MVALPRNSIALVAAATPMSLWAFNVANPFSEVVRPEFLSRAHDALKPGDRVMFACGPADERVHGDMVVVAIGPQVANQPRLVHTEVLAQTRLPTSRKLRVV
jgi:hypothetical protein